MNCISLQILSLEKEFGKRKELNENSIFMKEIQYYGVGGYFDGATKNGLCVARVVLLINNFHSFNFKLHHGTTINM